MYSIDLNCDMGEGIGPDYGQLLDTALMDFVSSVNIACGFHAGNGAIMQHTVQMAAKRGIAIGAHPGLPDKEGFGRVEMALTPREAYQLTLYQIGALHAFVVAEGVSLNHVKPHGALYNMAAAHLDLAEAIVQAMVDFDPHLILYGLAGSQLILAGNKAGISVANEVFADRTYQSNGMLTPRSQPNALLRNEESAIEQVVSMVLQKEVSSTDGAKVPIVAETICIHGDGPHALSFAKAVNHRLQESQIIVSPIKKTFNI